MCSRYIHLYDFVFSQLIYAVSVWKENMHRCNMLECSMCMDGVILFIFLVFRTTTTTKSKDYTYDQNNRHFHQHSWITIEMIWKNKNDWRRKKTRAHKKTKKQNRNQFWIEANWKQNIMPSNGKNINLFEYVNSLHTHTYSTPSIFDSWKSWKWICALYATSDLMPFCN